MMKPNYKTFEFTVPAGGMHEMFRETEFLVCLNADAEFQLQIDGGSKFDFEAGLGFESHNGSFKRMEFLNPGAQAIKIKVGLGKGGVRDARQTIANVVDTKPQTPDVFTTGAPISAANAATTALVAPNPKRRELIVSNDGTGKVYLAGTSGATAGQGLPLEAGGTAVLETTAAVWARNDSGGAVPVAVAQVEWS